VGLVLKRGCLLTLVHYDKQKWERSVKKSDERDKMRESDEEIKCNGQQLYMDLDIDIVEQIKIGNSTLED
jgi:hypothetical protein